MKNESTGNDKKPYRKIILIGALIEALMILTWVVYKMCHTPVSQ